MPFCLFRFYRLLLHLVCALCCVWLCSCASPESLSERVGVAYADLLSLEEKEGYIQATLSDGFSQGSQKQVYLLVPREAPLPSNLPEGIILRTPLQRVVACQSVHAALLCDLGADRSIVGLCDTDYIIDTRLQSLLRSGVAQDMGASYAPNAERLAANRPEAIITSPIEGVSLQPLARLGVPVIACADYMEHSALGRAEWMKFFGLLTGQSVRADSLFSVVTTAYDSLSTAAAKSSKRPRYISDRAQGSTWLMPGSDSFLAKLYADAGADYVFKDRKGAGSVSLPLETVVAKGHEADIWLIKYGANHTLSYETLAGEQAAYRSLRPWRERRVFVCNTLTVPYYEETPFRPDLLLRDMVKIFHPEVLPHHHLRYYAPLR